MTVDAAAAYPDSAIKTINAATHFLAESVGGHGGAFLDRTSALFTTEAGERYEMLTNAEGSPERDIYGRLRYRLVW